MDGRCVVLAAPQGGQLPESPLPRTEFGSEDLSRWDEMLCCLVRSTRCVKGARCPRLQS